MKVKDYKDLKVWRKYLAEKKLAQLTEDINHEIRMLINLIKKL